jgi:hypothetical protein
VNIKVRFQPMLTLTESFMILLILSWRRLIFRTSTLVTEPQHRMHCAQSSRPVKHQKAIMSARLS